MNGTAGYIADLEYTHGYYRELSPGLLRFACLAAGIVPPAGQSLTYLELGFGHGLSINIHAAAFPGRFWGTDFNPSQVANAQALAAASGSGATLLDESFAELAARPDLPDFDIIALHGIWTWISDENRRIIVDLIRRKLRVGGIAYISYNCLPGMAPILPLRHLLHLYASTVSNRLGLLGKVEEAIGFAGRVAAAGAQYFRVNPVALERLQSISKDEDRRYVAHEYFNAEWGLMFFSDLVRWLEPAKVTFAASVHMFDHVEALNISADGLRLLGGIDDPVLRESMKDYLVNQRFRKDIFVKGRRTLTAPEQMERMSGEKVVLTWPAASIPLEVATYGPKAKLQETVYRPIVEAMAEDCHAPKRLGDLLRKLTPRSISWAQLLEATLILLGAGYVQLAQEPTETARQRCARLNRHICEQARSGGKFEFLASPVTGTGMPVPRFPQLFLLAAENGRTSPADQAAFVWEIMAAQGEVLAKDGKPLRTAEENIAELTERAGSFAQQALPILKATGIA